MCVLSCRQPPLSSSTKRIRPYSDLHGREHSCVHTRPHHTGRQRAGEIQYAFSFSTTEGKRGIQEAKDSESTILTGAHGRRYSGSEEKYLDIHAQGCRHA